MRKDNLPKRLSRAKIFPHPELLGRWRGEVGAQKNRLAAVVVGVWLFN